MIYGADIADTASALACCDFERKTCGMKDERYVDELLSICQKDGIDLVVPAINTDLLVPVNNVARFDAIGVKLLISKPGKILICRDKNNASHFFEIYGLHAPRIYNDYLPYSRPYPCFYKPEDGSSSANA